MESHETHPIVGVALAECTASDSWWKRSMHVGTSCYRILNKGLCTVRPVPTMWEKPMMTVHSGVSVLLRLPTSLPRMDSTIRSFAVCSLGCAEELLIFAFPGDLTSISREGLHMSILNPLIIQCFVSACTKYPKRPVFRRTIIFELVWPRYHLKRSPCLCGC